MMLVYYRRRYNFIVGPAKFDGAAVIFADNVGHRRRRRRVGEPNTRHDIRRRHHHRPRLISGQSTHPPMSHTPINACWPPIRGEAYTCAGRCRIDGLPPPRPVFARRHNGAPAAPITSSRHAAACIIWHSLSALSAASWFIDSGR